MEVTSAEGSTLERLTPMTALIDEPRFSVESLQLLRRFQDSLRARIYNLVEDQVHRTGQGKVTPEMIEKCILQATREFSGEHQPTLFGEPACP